MSEITPEKVAAHLGYFSCSPNKALGLVIVNQSGPRLEIRVTRDGSTSVFRAVVVEGETDPIVLPTGAAADYINGDDGYHWLTCGTCEESLMEVTAGTGVGEMAAKIAAHTCPAEAAQAEKGGQP